MTRTLLALAALLAVAAPAGAAEPCAALDRGKTDPAFAAPVVCPPPAKKPKVAPTGTTGPKPGETTVRVSGSVEYQMRTTAPRR